MQKIVFLLSLCSSNALTYLDYWLVQQPWIILSPHGMLDTCVSIACSDSYIFTWWWLLLGSDVYQRKGKSLLTLRKPVIKT
jgi:hypothetical protein